MPVGNCVAVSAISTKSNNSRICSITNGAGLGSPMEPSCNMRAGCNGMHDTATQLPTGIDALLLVQPRKMPESMLRSIDAWAVAGKPLVVLADPFAETDQHPDSRAMGAKVSATTYDFPLL